MAAALDSVGVVVLEPNTQLLKKLCAVAAGTWGQHEVLPRATAKELANAAKFLKIGVVVVRASYQRSSELIQNTLADLYATGTQVVIIQDTSARLDRRRWVSIAGMHFLSDDSSDEQLHDLLALCLVRHCTPNVHRLI
ncbi:MAG TPA: hypothetical protein VGE55_07625 [Limnobacter sp.]|uniref:hypothetical protein n=1 Tax=Limnobacter sp. TaxID=2003368 RepID=UPI002EDA38DA